jgi:hypothetical protein
LRLLALPLAVVLVTAGLAGPALAASSDSVLTWNTHAVEALTNAPTAATPGAGQTPPVAVLHMAMVQAAVYDAVNAIAGGYQPYLEGLPAAPASASVDAAVATAAHDVLTGLTPPLPAVVRDRLDALYAGSLAAIADGANETAGIAIGAAAAAAMLASRVGDGRYTALSYTVGTQPGEWRPTPPGFVNDPFAWVAVVRPFTLDSSARYGTEGPLDMTSDAYATEFAEVKAIGSATSTTRTAGQTALALFYTESPVTLYNRTFRTIAGDRGLGSADAARLFASLNVAAADALITCTADKMRWGFWRPITAIRLADTDGNPATTADPTWSPLVANPPYPDHPSGYNCFTGAAFHTAKSFFGTDRVTFSVRNAAGVERQYHRFTRVIKDTIDGRIYLGIHFRTPDVQGAWLGKKVAQWVAGHEFRPLD